MKDRFVFLLSLLICGPAVASERPQDYSTRVELELAGDGPWYRLELPMALHLAGQYGDLRDLRVFNAQGQMQAYALHSGRQQYQQTRREADVARFPLRAEGPAADAQLRIRRDSTGTLVEVLPERAESIGGTPPLRGWLLDASGLEGNLETLVLDWSAEQEGFQRFRIEASDDLQNWRNWGVGQVARMAFDGARVEQNEVSLPGAPARYLRLLWDAGQPVAQLESARLVSLRSDSLPVPMIWTSAQAPVWQGNHEYRWELPMNLPLDRVRIELGEAGTLAPVTLAGRVESSQPWRPLSRGLLYRLEQEGAGKVQDELPLNGQPLRYLQLSVDPRGGGLGDAPRLAAGMHATQVIFLARGEGPYSVAVGRTGASSASLPLTTLIPDYRAERLAQLGVARAVMPDAAAQDAPAPAVGADGKRYGLWAVLLLGVALLAGMSLSLLRKPQEQPGG